MLKVFYLFILFHSYLQCLFALTSVSKLGNEYKLSLNDNWALSSLFDNTDLGDKYTKLYTSFNNINSKFSLIFESKLLFKEYFYAYSNLFFGQNYSSSQNNFNKYNFLRENKNDYLFSLDNYGIGYKNNWFKVEISKNRETWGAGEGIQLAMNDYSESYNYIQIGSDYGNLRVKYIHGFLEKRKEKNRYITARAIEWSNKKSIIIGLSEIVIYSGKNRPLDIGYINPMSSHLELEFNNKLNVVGYANANAVWQIHTDFLINKRVRISLNFLLDEFVIDRNIQKNKRDGVAYSSMISYYTSNKNFKAYIKTVSIGTPVFRHVNGENNFVLKSEPLGWGGGSDLQEYCLGFEYLSNFRFLLNIEYGFNLYGEENILSRPYDPYKSYNIVNFPSGIQTKNFFFSNNLKYHLSENLTFNFSQIISDYKNSMFNIDISYFFPYN